MQLQKQSVSVLRNTPSCILSICPFQLCRKPRTEIMSNEPSPFPPANQQHSSVKVKHCMAFSYVHCPTKLNTIDLSFNFLWPLRQQSNKN